MTSLPTGKALDAELVDLWARRDRLTPAEWERLYQIVFAVLGKYQPNELSGLPEDRAFYIQDFFANKVMKNRSSRVHHTGALRIFYKRHLIDHLRDAEQYDEHFVHARHTSDEESEDGWYENLPSDTTSATTPAEPFVDLEEHGLTFDAVCHSAREFLRRSEAWVPVYLAFHFCPDKQHSEALVSLAARLGISSYHRKATQLGINWDINSAGSQGRQFAETAIGRWVSQDLRIAIQPENSDAILAAFKILCLEALNWREDPKQGAEP